MSDPLVEQSAAYYARKLAEFGPTPRGVDWNSQASQDLRFRQLLRLCEGEERIAINDYGCGYGALVEALVADGRALDYGGYDAAPEMIAAARARYANLAGCQWTSTRSQLTPRAYTVASGIFNVKGQTPESDWWAYVVRTIDDIAMVSTSGFGFNFLTSYSDADRKRADLFYPDPSDVLRHCMGRFGRQAAVLHDYPLYEFTLLVRL